MGVDALGVLLPAHACADARLTGPLAPGNPLLILAPGSAHEVVQAVRDAPATLGAIFPELTLAHQQGRQRIPVSFALQQATHV